MISNLSHFSYELLIISKTVILDWESRLEVGNSIFEKNLQASSYEIFCCLRTNIVTSGRQRKITFKMSRGSPHCTRTLLAKSLISGIACALGTMFGMLLLLH